MVALIPVAAVLVAAVALGACCYSVWRAQRVADQNAAFSAAALAAGFGETKPQGKGAAKREQANKSALGKKLAAAGMDVAPGAWMLACIAAALLAAGAVAIIGNLVLAIVACIAVLVGANMFLSARAKKQTEEFSAELAGALPQIAENMRTGMTVERALSTVASYTDEPLRSELSRACSQLALGGALSDALYAMAARTESKDVKLVAQAVDLQRETGGNLADILDTVAEKVQSRLKLRRHIKSITSSARTQRYILCCLPWVAMGLSFLNADGAAEFWASFAGTVIICITIVLEIIGCALMSKICDMKIE